MSKLLNLTILLAFLVIALGAYTRLTDAGLGCPDWPGCYGFNSVPANAKDIASAQLAYPDKPLHTEKAWNEMIHRYIAGLLGMLILLIFITCGKRKQHVPLATLLVLLVLFQAALGMWTVTMNLQPIIVMGHLLGGFSILTLLVLLRLRLSNIKGTLIQATQTLNNKVILPTQRQRLMRIQLYCGIALPILIIQIALGGWTSSNYAAIVCTEFPICNGDWLSRFDFSDVFSLSPLAETYQYGVRDTIARMNIHITHRIWAGVTFIFLLLTAYQLFKSQPEKKIRLTAKVLVIVLCVQVSLGVANVFFQLPLSIAVAHNLVAAILLITLVTLLWLNQQQLQEVL
ncbi:Heme A synthase, cytochrome oxidase biogenesis protein Cox15-CtaA [Moritella sp. JT01]|uniref:COX15/CtaA family protein n=1 Tax=Moritella sp. JT01 TaxID=756698 RepID=UPI00079263C0|nr:COX15/CtaA family protein [Moritella sp. JT01]KXO14118.1 Heme A synthase, cytochrome oxidase biogenesis protein Cox15-CtaA [Moritella sp. JT01]